LKTRKRRVDVVEIKMTLTCVDTPGLDDTQILMVLDGVADKETREHVHACHVCGARAQYLAHLEDALASSLYRVTCPSPMELGEYHLGGLKRRQAKGITRHIAECPRCAREVAQLRSFLGDLAPEPEPAFLEQVRVQIARLVSGAASLLSPPRPAFAPAYVGVRGGGGEPAIYEAGGAQVILGAQPNPSAGDRFDLLGLVTGIDYAGLSAHLWQAGRLIATIPVDEGGNFVFGDLPSAGYELVLNGPGQEIYIEELRI
jgi:hypothetical protein